MTFQTPFKFLRLANPNQAVATGLFAQCLDGGEQARMSAAGVQERMKRPVGVQPGGRICLALRWPSSLG